MATPNSELPTQKSFSLLSAIFITFFLLLARKVNSAKAISFDFTEFTSNTGLLILQGDAQISPSGILQLTNPSSSWNTGRALYTTPIPLWNSTTGNVASFVSSFSFVVEDIGAYIPADGIVFFLAPEDTEIPPNSGGGSLGIINSASAFNPVVFVEFDSYTNEFDPDYAHIGINVNSLTSLKTVRWKRVSGRLVTVSIIYDSLARTLSVAVAYKDGRIATVSQVVDLKAVLPEKVRVGLSATTTESRETHNIYSWSFTSTLKTKSVVTESDDQNLASYA